MKETMQCLCFDEDDQEELHLFQFFESLGGNTF